MNIEHSSADKTEPNQGPSLSADFTHVVAPARIACYDDPKAAPRVITIEPAPTYEFIEKLASTIHEQSRMLGGKIAYTAIREVSENFIHARFEEVVVSILDDGNTIRFADQGPGISEKQKALLPGFTSAIEPMKHYIRGVGSGFPLTTEYIESSHGTITIEDNLHSGAVVTLSLVGEEKKAQTVAKSAERSHSEEASPYIAQGEDVATHRLNDQQSAILSDLLTHKRRGVTDLAGDTGIAVSSVHSACAKLQDWGYVAKDKDKKRVITQAGIDALEAHFD